MKKTIRNAVILASVVLPATATLALGQYKIDNGQARDANNRVGSGGFNTAGQLNGRINGLAGNYVVTGNVTGGRAFRGALGYTDPTSFRGSLGSASFDSYIRDSISASQMRGTNMGGGNFATIQPFFGAQAAAAPAGFARDPNSGAFYLPPARSAITPGDGRIDFGGASRADISQGILSAQRATGGAGISTATSASMNQRDKLTNLTQMSDFTAIGKPANRSSTFGSTDGIMSGPRVPQAAIEKPLVDPTESKSNDPASIGLTGQGKSFKDLRAIDNNPQYAELRKRMEARGNAPKLPGSEATESLNKINADMAAARAKEKTKSADDTRKESPSLPTNAIPGTSHKSDLPNVDPKTLPEDNLNLPRPKGDEAAVVMPPPLEITSLTTGVKDKDLGKLLGEAEAAMKVGKFSTAIEAYDRAEEIASDDPLVFMGRSIAELGGSYYRSSELHLRQAFAADPALLGAKFDLRNMLTDDRLNFLQGDLAAIAKKNSGDAGPLLLLAFIYYNTGFPERSERALEMAQERAGGNDEGAKMLKQAWFHKSPAAEQNK